jgi:hypothetical protein
MRLKVSRASSSVIRKMWLRLNVRAAALSKKCCDIGPNPLSGKGPCAAVEIELQLDYIPTDDHDAGPNPRVVVEEPAAAATVTGSASKIPTSGPLSSVEAGERPFAFPRPASGSAIRPGL